MKNNLLKLYIIAFFFVGEFYSFAQPGTDNPDGDLEGTDAPPTPINAKLIYLAIIGIAFAFYFFAKRKEAKTN